MSETTRETLVRTIIQAIPDGSGIKRTERVEVEVTWPDGKPEGSRSYRERGSWRIAEEVGDR